MIHEQLMSLSEEIHKMDDSLNELRKKATSFLLQYVDNYEQVYFLSQLHSSKVVVDNLKVWKATADNAVYNMSSRLENILSIKDIPSPVEKPERFTEYIKKNIKRLGKTETAKLEALCKTFSEIEEQSSFWEWPFDVDGFEKAFEKLRAEAPTCISLEKIPMGYEWSDKGAINVPIFVEWQGQGGKPNFRLFSNDYERLETLVATLLVAFPVGKMRVSFVDLGFTREIAILKNKLHKSLVEQYILDESDFAKWVTQKSRQLQTSFAEIGDVVEYNMQNGIIHGNYELCVLCIPSGLRKEVSASLQQLIRQGHHLGLYFAIVETDAMKPCLDDGFITFAYDNYPDCLSSSEGKNRLFAGLGAELEKEKTALKQKEQIRKLEANQKVQDVTYKDATKEFAVEMGANDNGQVVNLTFESPHLLVLGKTGSGKSNFLHLLLTKSMLKYSPETLNFYLMDMKPGGVELADYRDIPHVNTLVADPGDSSINVEFLQRIKDQVEQRARKMQKAGVRDLLSYNARNPQKVLPRIVILIDEFQSLFDRKKYPDLSMLLEVESLLSDILAKGRSYGINVVLATQTLMGTQIPESVAKIEKQYFLKAETFDMGDIRMFVRNVQEELLAGIGSHGAFSVNNSKGTIETFLPDLLLDNESRSLTESLEAIRNKCRKYEVNGNGTVYYSVTQLECPDMCSGLEDAYYGDFPEVSLGRSVEINSQNVTVRFEDTKGQNLLVVGINERGRFCIEEGGKWQGLRILLVSLLSLLHYSRKQGEEARFVLLLNSPDIKPGTKAYDYLENLRDNYGVEIIRSVGEQLDFVEKLYDRAKASLTGQPLYVFVEGQDYYRLDRELKNEDTVGTVNQSEESKLFSFGNKPFGVSANQKLTVRDAWTYILENGPMYRIYTIWQIQNFERFIVESSVVRRYFQNIAILYNATLRPINFKITNDIDFKRLDYTNERLRMCLFDGIDVNVMAPYQLPYMDELEEFIN